MTVTLVLSLTVFAEVVIYCVGTFTAALRQPSRRTRMPT